MAAWSLSWSAAAPSSPHFRPAPAPSPGFSETAVPFTGLASPTALAFSPDGRVFVAEQSGLIKVFDGPGDTTPTSLADLQTETHNFWDRGLLGMELDPRFPDQPLPLRLLHVRRADRRYGAAWGSSWAVHAIRVRHRQAPTADGCVVSGRLSRLTADRQHHELREGADQRLVPAIPEPLRRRYCVRRRWVAVYGWRGRRIWGTTDYGQDGNPLTPAVTRRAASEDCRRFRPRREARFALRTFGRPAIRSG